VKLSDSHYERLTASERTALLFEALRRGDQPEACRLTDTCPVKTYSATDLGYYEGVSTLSWLATQLALKLMTAKYSAVCAMLAMVQVEMSADALVRARAEEAEKALSNAVALHGALLEAWKEFCAAKGLDSDGVLGASCDGTDWITAPMVGVGSPITHDPEAQRAMARCLTEVWDAHRFRMARAG
jgi:hypothetical protein